MTQRKKPTRKKMILAWGGFDSGQLWFEEACDEFDMCGERHFTPAIYSRKADAKKRWTDVRRILITEAPKARSRR